MISDVVLGGLTKSMDALTNQIRAAMDFADKAQKASLALGQTYEATRTQLGGTMEGLRGDINQRFGAAVAGLEAGLQGNTAGVARLINQQQLTGTAYQQTAKAFAGLESSLLLSRDQTNNLSNSLIETGAEYQISTDKLVGAIDALKSTFPAQALAGMGDKVMGAVAGLQGELGPQLAGPLQSVMSMVMDTSMEGYERLTKLGISDVRERLSAAKSSAEAQQILKDAFVTASNNFKSVAGDASKGFFQIGVASEIFGQQAIQLTTVADNLGKRTKKEGEDAADFGMTLANLKAEILVPFQEALSKFYPVIVKSFDALSLVARRVVERFSTFLEGALPEADKAFKKVTLAVIDFAILGLNTFDKFRNKVGLIIDEIFPKIKNSFMGIQTAIHYGIVIPLEAVKIAFDVFMNGLDAIYGAFLLIVKALATAINELPFANLESVIGKVDSQLESVGQRIVDRADSMNKSFDIIKTDPAESARQFSEKLKKANEDPNLLGNRLLSDLRDDFANSRDLQREQNKELKEINKKTPEIATTPEFLDETANMLGRSIEGILGVGRDTTAEEMLEELRLANEQRAAQGDRNPSSMIDTGS